MIDQQFVQILRCPIDGSELELADSPLLRRVNQAIEQGRLRVISPVISNVFLHYVLDLWFEQKVKPRLREFAFLIRYADDFVIGFRDQRDAERVLEVIPKRFGKYGLTVHPPRRNSFRSVLPPRGGRMTMDPMIVLGRSTF